MKSEFSNNDDINIYNFAVGNKVEKNLSMSTKIQHNLLFLKIKIRIGLKT